jgi:hypothetical protein
MSFSLFDKKGAAVNIARIAVANARMTVAITKPIEVIIVIRSGCPVDIRITTSIPITIIITNNPLWPRVNHKGACLPA